MAPPVPVACTTCGAPLPAGSDRCARCGTLHGEHRRCPGCGAKAEVISKGGMLFVCAACGRPRVPMEQPGIVRSFREREALGRADGALRDSLLGNVLGIIGVVIAAFVAVGAVLAFALDFTFVAVIFLVVAAALGVFGALGFSRAKGAKRRAEEAMRDAFGSVAVDVLRQRGPTSSRALGEILGVPEPIADAALARLPARDDVRVDTVVDDRAADGLVRYRIADDGTLPAEALAGQDPAAASFDARLQAAMRAKGNS